MGTGLSCGHRSGSLRSPSSFKPLLQLKKYPDIPVCTIEEARGSRPHPEEPRFRLEARDEGSFPCFVGKELPAFPTHFKRRRSPQERREDLQRRATIPRVPQMFQSIPEEPVFPALPRLSRRGSTPPTVARGTAQWESLMGKPRGKATDPLIQATGSVTLLLPLWRKAHMHAPIRDEDLVPWGDSRRTPRSMSALERNPQVPAPTPHKVLGPVIEGLRPRHQRERNSERPPRNSHGDWPFLRPPERVPEGPVKYPKIHVSTGEESSGSGPEFTQELRPRHQRERNSEKPPRNSHGDWPFLRPPERVPEGPVKYPKIHVSTGEESSGSGPEFTQELRPRHQRERNSEKPPRNSHGDWPFLRPPERVPEGPVKYPKIHVSTGEESSGSGPEFTQELRPRHQRERNSEKPPRNSHGDWPFLRPPERVPEGPVKYPKIHVSTGEESSGSGPEFTQELRPRHQRERNSEKPPRNSHGDWPFLRPPERVPEGPVKYPKIHVSTGEESSGSGPEFTQGLRPRHQRERNSEWPPRNSHGDWPFLRPPERVPEGPVGKNSRRSRRISRGGALDRKVERNSRVVPPFQESPRCVSPFQRNLFSLHCLDVQAEDRLPPRVLQKYPKIHVSTGEESSGSGPEFTQGLRPRHQRERNSERPPRNSHGDWPFLRPPERVPEGPVPRIDSHHVCTWDSPVGKPRGKDTRENHRCFDPRGGLRDTAATALEESASACPHSRRGLTPLGRLQKYPKIHVSTGEESSGSGPEFTQGLRPRHQRERNSERPPRNSHGDWPFLRPPERVPEGPVGKNSRRSRRISRGGALHRKGERNSRVVPPFQESPRCVSPFQRNRFSLHCLDVQAEDRLPPRVHVGQPCGKASWESLVGKPRGKDTRENHRCFDPRGGLRDTAATALEESASACPHSRRGLTPLGRLQKYPKIHVSTGEESSGSGPEFTQGLRPRHQRERNSERPPRNSHGDWPFLRPPERVPEGPVGKNSRRSRRISRGGALHRKGERNSRVVPPFQESPRCVSPFQRNRFSLHCLDVQAEDRLPPRVHVGQPCGKASWESLVGKPRGKDTRENHRCFDPRGGLRDTAATALEESASACPHSRRGLTPLGRLQKYPKIHVSTGEESSGSGPEFTQGLRPRHQRERNSERPPRNSHGDWPFLRPPERVPEGPVPRIDSHHVCTWDSPVGKPRGKDTRENHRCFDPRGGLRDTAATALEESASACPHSSRGLTPLARLQKYPKIHVSTGEESSGSGPEFTQGLRPRHQRERNSERPPRNSHGDWPFLRPPERVPEGPVPRIDSHHVCTWDSPVGKPRGKASWESLVGKTRGKTIDALIHGADCVTLLLPLWRKAQVHARIRDED
ncbi:hypothetical protein MJG53_000303 [Ovis ammon polii x Ovis aries]|nr:hypothetical protein MJG53_000303 [Ovis ammon polii x Ovis aries]